MTNSVRNQKLGIKNVWLWSVNFNMLDENGKPSGPILTVCGFALTQSEAHQNMEDAEDNAAHYLSTLGLREIEF